MGQIANKIRTKMKRKFLTWVQLQFGKAFGLKSIIRPKSENSIVVTRLSHSFPILPSSLLLSHFPSLPLSSFLISFSLFLSLWSVLASHSLSLYWSLSFTLFLSRLFSSISHSRVPLFLSLSLSP